MAYAAAATVLQIVEDILHPRLDQHRILHDKQQIESLQENLNFFHDFLEESWHKQGTGVLDLERKIRNAAHKAQDTIESYISTQFLKESEKDREMSCKIFVQDLELVTKEIDYVKKKVSMLMDVRAGATNQHHHIKCLPTRPSTRSSTMVGFDDDLVQLKDRLTSYQSKLQIIPIVGMGGTGKTTLTKNLYNDDYIREHFDVRAWVTVSQQYRVREILVGLLESMGIPSVEMGREGNDYLSCLYQNLKGRRYLIVMDDVWTTEVMDEMKMLFPDDHTGSRIMITTRLSDVATYADSYRAHQHHMHFLSDHESWNLLCSKVFTEEGCPLELRESGKKIARSCKGLPLAIVVISGLLTKVERTRHHWDLVANNVNSIVIENDVQCSELLSLSYDHLPHHLKACFLYLGLFPEDEKIRVSKLIKLWVAEGFLKPIACKSSEEVAEEYLEDLISRNLVLIDEKRIDGKIKTCNIHDLLRDLCVRKAKEEMFHDVINFDAVAYYLLEDSTRRLTFYVSYRELYHNTLEINKPTRALSLIRSLICTPMLRNIIQFYGFLPNKLLRVLDLGETHIFCFPIVVIELAHLRYLAFSSRADIYIPEFLPNYLWNLQTLIIHQISVCNRIMGTQVFWRMPQLRHLHFKNCYLHSLIWNPLFSGISVLENLQTLSEVNSSSCTPELFKRTPNLKKLGIRVSACDYDKPFSLGNLVNLHQLQMLKCVVERRAYVSIPKIFSLPRNLKRLTLKRTRIPWKHMSVVGSLPCLLVLKLIDNGFKGHEWETVDGEFRELKYLLIEGSDLQYWKAERDHFPSLEQLILRSCSVLEEIPCGIGDIPTLQIIELVNASLSTLSSARQILEEQQSLGNEQLQVSTVSKRGTNMYKELLNMLEKWIMKEWIGVILDEDLEEQRTKMQKERLNAMRKAGLQEERIQRERIQRERMNPKWMCKYTTPKRGKLLPR